MFQLGRSAPLLALYVLTISLHCTTSFGIAPTLEWSYSLEPQIVPEWCSPDLEPPVWAFFDDFGLDARIKALQSADYAEISPTLYGRAAFKLPTDGDQFAIRLADLPHIDLTVFLNGEVLYEAGDAPDSATAEWTPALISLQQQSVREGVNVIGLRIALPPSSPASAFRLDRVLTLVSLNGRRLQASASAALTSSASVTDSPSFSRTITSTISFTRTISLSPTSSMSFGSTPSPTATSSISFTGTRSSSTSLSNTVGYSGTATVASSTGTTPSVAGSPTAAASASSPSATVSATTAATSTVTGTTASSSTVTSGSPSNTPSTLAAVSSSTAASVSAAASVSRTPSVTVSFSDTVSVTPATVASTATVTSPSPSASTSLAPSSASTASSTRSASTSPAAAATVSGGTATPSGSAAAAVASPTASGTSSPSSSTAKGSVASSAVATASASAGGASVSPTPSVSCSCGCSSLTCCSNSTAEAIKCITLAQNGGLTAGERDGIIVAAAIAGGLVLLAGGVVWYRRQRSGGRGAALPTSVKKGRKGARTGASRRSRPPLPGDRRRRNQRRGGEEEEDEWDDAVSSDEEPQAAGGEEKERASPQPSTESVEATDANPAATSGKKRASDDDANVNLKGASGIVKKTGAFSPPPAPSSVASSHSRRSVGVTSAQPLQPPNVPTQPQFDLQSLVRVPASAVTVCERCSPTTRMRPPLSVSPSHAHPVSVSEYQGEDSRRYIVQRVLVPSPTRGASRGVSSSSPSAAWPSTAPSSVSVDRPPSVMQAHASGKKIKLRLVRVKRVRVPRGSSGISLPTGTTAPPPPPLTSSPPPHSYYY